VTDQRLNRAYLGLPVAEILLDGYPPSSWGLEEEFSDVVIRQSYSGITQATLTYSPVDYSTLDSELFLNGGLVRIFVGYPRVEELQRIDKGTFFIEHSEVVHNENRPPALVLTCYDIGISTTREEKRRSFRNIRDFTIAKQIADEHGVKTETEDGVSAVDSTFLDFEQVTQAGETDFAFLRRRAALYGYEFFIDRNIMHFRLPRITTPTATFGPMAGVPIIFARGGPDAIKAGMKFTHSDFNPITGEVVSVSSDGMKNEMTAASRRGFEVGNLRSHIDIAGGTFEKFVYGFGHRPSVAEVTTGVDGAANRNAYLNKIDVIVPTVPHIDPLDTVEIAGFGRFGGVYIISKAVHEVGVEMGKQSRLVLMRSFEGVGLPVEKLVSPSSVRGVAQSDNIKIRVEDYTDQR